MVKTIDIREADKNLKKLLEEVRSGANQYVIKDNGHELAVLISFNDFQHFTGGKEHSKKRFFEIVDKIRERNKDVPYEQIKKDVSQAVAEVKQMELEELETL